MNISAHDYSNQFFPGAGWDLSWTSQKLVTSAIVTATGGTYETKAPEVPVKPKKKVSKSS